MRPHLYANCMLLLYTRSKIIDISGLTIHVPQSPITPYIEKYKALYILPDKREAAAACSAFSSGRKINTQQQCSGISSVLSSLFVVQLAMATFIAKHTQP